jgi:hypothetical protein
MWQKTAGVYRFNVLVKRFPVKLGFIESNFLKNYFGF